MTKNKFLICIAYVTLTYVALHLMQHFFNHAQVKFAALIAVTYLFVMLCTIYWRLK